MPLLPNINVGTTANDGTGDDLRTAFTTVNENFQYIEAFFPNTSNIGLTANIASTGTSSFNNVIISNVTSAVTFTSAITADTYITAAGNVTGANLVTAGNLYANNITATGNVSAGNVSATGLTGTLSTATQPNITSVGTLTGLTLSGTLIGTTLNSATIGNVDSIITGATVEAATIGNSGTVLTGTLTTATQPNITEVGTLSNLSLEGYLFSSGGIYLTNIKSETFTVTNNTDSTIGGNINVQFYSNSTTFIAWNINSNVTLLDPTYIQSGYHKKTFFVNESGSTLYITTFNSRNNLGTNVITVSNSTVASIDFHCFDNTSANIFQTISNT